MQACRTFLTARLLELIVPGGAVHPYSDGLLPPLPEGQAPDPEAVPPVKTIFFDELPVDFLKDNGYAVCCLPLQDRTRRHGKLIAKKLDEEKTEQTLTRRRFRREILFRCLLYGSAESLWGTDQYTGLVDQFSQGVANYRVIAAGDNSAISIEPSDAVRPWDSETEQDRKLRRPRLAIVRVQFSGGVQTTETQQLIRDVTLTPDVA